MPTELTCIMNESLYLSWLSIWLIIQSELSSGSDVWSMMIAWKSADGSSLRLHQNRKLTALPVYGRLQRTFRQTAWIHFIKSCLINQILVNPPREPRFSFVLFIVMQPFLSIMLLRFSNRSCV